MSLSLAGLWLLGELFGGGSGDCRQSADASARAMRTIVESWPLRYAGDSVRRYVQDLGERIASHAASGGTGDWHFYVVRNMEPTAFAVGGRQFVVSDGLIAFVRNESDLAAVLAHEIAHQRLGHFCRDAPSDPQRIRYGSIVQHFDPDTERAADAEAVHLLAVSGYDPGSMYEVLRCLAERPGAPVTQLQTRMRALGRRLSSSTEDHGGHGDSFEAIRGQIVEEFGKSMRRCH